MEIKFKRACGLRLKTFSLVIGWLEVVTSFILIIATAIVLALADDLTKFIITNYHNIDDAKAVHYEIVVLFGIYLAITAINFVASAMLVYRTVKERHLLLVPWLLKSGIGLFFSTLFNVVLMIALIVTAKSIVVVLMLIPCFLILGLQYYIHFGILSCYKEIRNNASVERRPSHPLTEPIYPIYTKL